MNIVLDARLYGVLENTGIGRYTVGLINGLKRIDNNNQYYVLLREKYFNQLNFPSNWKKVLADFRHYSLAEQIKLPGLINKLQPDVTHFVHFNVPLLYKKPFVVTIHDLLMHKQKGTKATTLPAPIYFTKRLGYKAVFSHAVKGSRKIIVPSEVVKKEVEGYYKIPSSKITAIYEGVDVLPSGKNQEPILRRYGLSKDQYFVYAGNAYPHKNLRRGIEAILALNKNTKEKYLFAIVCARNIFSQKLAKEIKDLKAEEYVKLLGFVPDEQLGVLYRNSLAFLYPSLSEGFGLPGLEAILSGSVACVSDIPVFQEIYQENAIYFNPYDTPEIEKALKKVIEMDEKERQNFIGKGQMFVKRYSWDKMAETTLKVYEDCARLR